MITAAFLLLSNDNLEFIRGYSYTAGEVASPASKWLDYQPELRGSGEIALYKGINGKLFTVRSYHESQDFSTPIRGRHRLEQTSLDIARYDSDRVIEKFISNLTQRSELGKRIQVGSYGLSGKLSGTEFEGKTWLSAVRGADQLAYDWQLRNREVVKPYVCFLEALVLFNQDLNEPYSVMFGGSAFEKGPKVRNAPGGLVKHSQIGPLNSYFDTNTRQHVAIMGRYTEFQDRQSGAVLGGCPIVYPDGTLTRPIITISNGGYGSPSFNRCTPRPSFLSPGLQAERCVELRPLSEDEASKLADQLTPEWTD